MSQQFIEPVKDLCDASGSVVVTDECKHQRTASEIDGEEHFAALTPFDRVHLNDSDIGVGGDEFLKIVVGTPYMALLIDTDRLFLLTDSVPHLPGKVNVTDGQKSCINVVVDGFLIKHDVIRILNANVMNGLSLLYEGSDNCIYALKLLLGYGKALTAFAEHCLVFLLGVLRIIQMPLKFTTVSLHTAIADIRRLEDVQAMLLLKIRASLVAVFTTSTTVLTVLLATRFADISVMGTGLAVQTRIE